MEWEQVYDPLGSPLLSTLMAGLPIVVLLGLIVCGVSAHRAAVLGLLAALAIAIWRIRHAGDSAAGARPATGPALGCCPSAGSCWPPCSCYHLTVRIRTIRRSSNARWPPFRPTGGCRPC